MIHLVVAVLCFCISGYFFYRLKKSWEVPPQKFDVPDTQEFRVAVHEAGHAVAAWFCTAVNEIDEVTIEAPTGGGHVKYEYNHHPSFKESDWCILVICLSGIAAEAVVYRRIRSGPAHKDLAQARKIASRIIDAGWQKPPWNIDKSSMPFDKMFEEPLSQTETKVLQQAFQYSKQLIWNMIKEHHQFVVLLLKKRTINHNELSKHFGNREFSYLGNFFRARFIGLDTR